MNTNVPGSYMYRLSSGSNKIIMVLIWHPCMDLHLKDIFHRSLISCLFINLWDFIVPAVLNVDKPRMCFMCIAEWFFKLLAYCSGFVAIICLFRLVIRILSSLQIWVSTAVDPSMAFCFGFLSRNRNWFTPNQIRNVTFATHILPHQVKVAICFVP